MPKQIIGSAWRKRSEYQRIRTAILAANGGGTPAFSPDDVTWDIRLESDQIEQEDASAVSSWTGLAGGDTATQGTALQQPTFQTNELNGYGVVQFDAANDNLAVAVSGAQKPFTYIVVAKPSNFTEGRSLIGGDAEGSIQFGFSATTGKLFLNKAAVAAIGTGTNDVDADVWGAFAVTYSNAGAYAFYKNGAADGTGTNNQTFGASNTRIGGIHVLGDAQFTSQVAAIYRAPSVLDADTLASMFAWLNAKYDLY